MLFQKLASFLHVFEQENITDVFIDDIPNQRLLAPQHIVQNIVCQNILGKDFEENSKIFEWERIFGLYVFFFVFFRQHLKSRFLKEQLFQNLGS